MFSSLIVAVVMETDSPRAPWQMSVRVAPSMINWGRAQTSYKHTNTQLQINQTNFLILLTLPTFTFYIYHTYKKYFCVILQTFFSLLNEPYVILAPRRWAWYRCPNSKYAVSLSASVRDVAIKSHILMYWLEGK